MMKIEVNGLCSMMKIEVIGLCSMMKIEVIVDWFMQYDEDRGDC